MTTCPTCGKPTHEAAPASNSKPQVAFLIDQEMMPLFTTMFREFANRSGMMGYGNYANTLNRLSKPFYEAKPEFMKGFSGEGWAQALIAHDQGYEMVVQVDEEKKKILVGGYKDKDDEKGIVLATAHVYEGRDVTAHVAAIEDLFARRPQPEPEEDAPEGPRT